MAKTVLFEHFYKNKASHHKQTAQFVLSVVVTVLLLNYNFVIYIMAQFIEEFASLKICLFWFYTSVVKNVPVYIAFCHTQGMFNLGQICQTCSNRKF